MVLGSRLSMWPVIRLPLLNLTSSNELIGKDGTVYGMLWTVFLEIGPIFPRAIGGPRTQSDG